MWLSSTCAYRDWLDVGVLVFKHDDTFLFLNEAILVKVDVIKQAISIVINLQLWQLLDKKGIEDILLFPFWTFIRHDSREIRVATVEVLDGTLTLYLLIFVEFLLEAYHNGINDRVYLWAVLIRTHQFVYCHLVYIILGVEVECLNRLGEVIGFVHIRHTYEDSCLVIPLE